MVMAHRTPEAGPSKVKIPHTKQTNGLNGEADDLEVDVDVESVSGSEDENESEYHDALSPSPGRKGKGRAIPSPMTPRRTPASEEMPKAKRSGMSRWAELDLSIIVALVSPIGNWLTGGDHIKNVFLIILLIFYLHQIVESTFMHTNLSSGP